MHMCQKFPNPEHYSVLIGNGVVGNLGSDPGTARRLMAWYWVPNPTDSQSAMGVILWIYITI